MATTNSNSQSIRPCLQLFSELNDFVERFGAPATNLEKQSKDSHTTPLVVDKGLKWHPTPGKPQVLTVKFVGLPGTTSGKDTLEKIKKAAKIWEDYANIKFTWTDGEDAIIRCGFVPKSGHWSYCGQDNLKIDKSKNTMNLDFRNSDDDNEIRGTTLHEFGHAMGCVHEQVSPKILGQITWIPSKIYAYYAKDPNNWDKATVDNAFNSFRPESEADVESSDRWDRRSIMQYEILPEWNTQGISVPRNNELTSYDKEFIGIMYPKK